MGKYFVRLYQSCRQKMERLHLESMKTFNMVSLAAVHPRDQERQTAVGRQREREQAAQSEYAECPHDLVDRLERGCRPYSRIGRASFSKRNHRVTIGSLRRSQ